MITEKYDWNIAYDRLNNLKYSKKLNLGLNLQAILQKDYKEFRYKNGNCGYSIIFIGISDLLEKWSLD